MNLQFLVQKKTEHSKLAYLNGPVLDLSSNDTLTLCLVEAGMVSGEPSIVIVSENDMGSIILQTSLDKYLSGAVMAMSSAQTQFGWKQPDGYASLMPMDKASRKLLLEKIKTELEEWDDLDV